MALTKEAYQALEAIVGAENISEEPAILDGYAYCFMVQPYMQSPAEDYFMPNRPEAVLLPATPEEIQAIQRACNRFNIKSHAFGTGWFPGALAGPPGVISLDLRRMNRIIEIDEKNMYAVVEPYITFGQLHAEAIKKGLRPHVIGPGPTASVVASHAACCGMGPSSINTSHSSRNVLGVEWVLPTGEVLKLGSLGQGAGWFSGDGPGPSIRGIMRGYMGSFGALGVFTKIAVKLYPWPGPDKHLSTGKSPCYDPIIPERMRSYILAFPSWDALHEAEYLIAEAEMTYSGDRAVAGWHGAMMTESNQDFYDLWQKGILQKIAFGFGIVLGGHSDEELEYQEKCLKLILKKTGGSIDKELDNVPHATGSNYWWHLWGGEIIKGIFRGTGSFFCAATGDDTIDSACLGSYIGESIMKPYKEKGLFLDEIENVWGSNCYEQATIGSHSEPLYQYDPYDIESTKAAIKLGFDGVGAALQTGIGLGFFENAGEMAHSMTSPHAHGFHKYMKKIKKVFDPNTASDPHGYSEPEA